MQAKVDHPAKSTGRIWAVALVGGTDIPTLEHVSLLLRSKGISNFSQGSVVYGVYVDEADAPRALDILRDFDRTSSAWIDFHYVGPVEWTSV